MTMLLTLVLAVLSILMICVILLQRGRGGGIAGALGGMGGQSAFGTKAGDIFTRITVGMAVLWVVLNCASIFANRSQADRYYRDTPETTPAMTADEKPGAAKGPAGATKETTAPAENKDAGKASDKRATEAPKSDAPAAGPQLGAPSSAPPAKPADKTAAPVGEKK